VVGEDIAPLAASNPLPAVVERRVALGQLLMRQAPERIVSEAPRLRALIDLEQATERVITIGGIHRPAGERAATVGIGFGYFDHAAERVPSRPPLAPPRIGYLDCLSGLARSARRTGTLIVGPAHDAPVGAYGLDGTVE